MEKKQLTIAIGESTIDNGELRMDNRELTIANGESTIDNGELRMDNRELTIDNGDPGMDNEPLRIDNGEVRTDYEELSFNNCEELIEDCRPIAENSERKMENRQLIAADELTKIKKKEKELNHPLRSNFYFLLFTFYFLFFTFCFCFAQDSPSVKTTIDRTHILIGEQIRLGIDVSYPTGEPVLLPQPDTIPHFVMLGRGSVDSLVTANSTSYHLEWKLTSFDSGVNKIPALPIAIGNGRYHSDSLLVEVSYGDLDSAKEYRDIKGIIDNENPAVKYIAWVLLALTVLSIILFILSATRPLPRTEQPGAPNPVGLSPFDEAMASLETLRKLALTDAAAVKKYYSGMNDALRIYLSRSMGLATMERTNEELILQLSRLEMNMDFFTHLAGTLRMSDFVKFAKYIPDMDDNDRNLEVISSAIVLINETQKNSVKRLVQ